MPKFRPVSDLRNHFADISHSVHESREPVFLTKNGRGNMVVMSYEAYEALHFESEVYAKLREAARQAETMEERLSHDELFRDLRHSLKDRP